MDSLGSRKPSFYVVLAVAAATNLLATAVLNIGENYGEQSRLTRSFLPATVFLEYAMSYAAFTIDSFIAFSGGFLVTAAIILTLASGAFAVVFGSLVMLVWQGKGAIFEISFLLFCVLGNLAFLAFASRHAYRIRNRTTVLGTVIGISAALVLPWIAWRSW